MRKIKFKYCGTEEVIMLDVNDADEWFIVDDYKIHYCEEYNSICVYEDNDEYKLIHKENII